MTNNLVTDELLTMLTQPMIFKEDCIHLPIGQPKNKLPLPKHFIYLLQAVWQTLASGETYV